MNVIKILKNPNLVIEFIAGHCELKWLPSKLYLRIVYRARIGKRLKLNPPKSFNEKLQYLKLYDHNPFIPVWLTK